MPDLIGAIVLGVAAIVLLAWGLRKALREDSVPTPPTARFLEDEERARRYHSSDQFGR